MLRSFMGDHVTISEGISFQISAGLARLVPVEPVATAEIAVLATKEISTGPVPVGSQLVSYQTAKRRVRLSSGLVPEEATTSQLLTARSVLGSAGGFVDAAPGFEGQRLRPVGDLH